MQIGYRLGMGFPSSAGALRRPVGHPDRVGLRKASGRGAAARRLGNQVRIGMGPPVGRGLGTDRGPEWMGYTHPNQAQIWVWVAFSAPRWGRGGVDAGCGRTSGAAAFGPRDLEPGMFVTSKLEMGRSSKMEMAHPRVVASSADTVRKVLQTNC